MCTGSNRNQHEPVIYKYTMFASTTTTTTAPRQVQSYKVPHTTATAVAPQYQQQQQYPYQYQQPQSQQYQHQQQPEQRQDKNDPFASLATMTMETFRQVHRQTAATGTTIYVFCASRDASNTTTSIRDTFETTLKVPCESQCLFGRCGSRSMLHGKQQQTRSIVERKQFGFSTPLVL
eukprot:scaffold6644_cov65-Cylindrotheca_fusiformis.AAC.1